MTRWNGPARYSRSSIWIRRICDRSSTRDFLLFTRYVYTFLWKCPTWLNSRSLVRKRLWCAGVCVTSTESLHGVRQDDNWCCLEVEWLVSSCWQLFCCSFWVNRLYRRTTWVSLFLIFFADLCWKFSVKYNNIKLTKITKCEVWNVIIQMYCTCNAVNIATNFEFYISILYSF